MVKEIVRAMENKFQKSNATTEATLVSTRRSTSIHPRQSLEAAEKRSTEEVQVLNEHLAELQNGQGQEA